MTGLGLQDALAALAVLGAVVYLVRRKFRPRPSGACQTCDGCVQPPAEGSAAPLLSIESPAPPRVTIERLGEGRASKRS